MRDRIAETRPTQKPPKNGRKAFKGLAPAGYRIRMMEPGEAPRLFEIERAGALLLASVGKSEAAGEQVDIERFTRFLLAHEIFVAIRKEDGLPVAYAAAAPESDLYWLAGLDVDPDHGRLGIGTALVEAVLMRASWFFFRAVGLSTYGDVPCGAPFYERLGFLRVADAQLPQWLADKRRAETPGGGAGEDRTVMIKWL